MDILEKKPKKWCLNGCAISEEEANQRIKFSDLKFKNGAILLDEHEKSGSAFIFHIKSKVFYIVDGRFCTAFDFAAYCSSLSDFAGFSIGGNSIVHAWS